MATTRKFYTLEESTSGRVLSQFAERSTPNKLTYDAQVLQRDQSAVADLQSHRAVESFPSFEDPHQQIHQAHFHEFRATKFCKTKTHTHARVSK